MADERDRLANIKKLEAQMAEQKKESDAAAKRRADAVVQAREAQSIARAEQLKAQREAKALADRLGATVDTKTGLIKPETVTNPFGVFGPKGAKTKVATGYRGTGKDRVFFVRYADGTEDITAAPESVGGSTGTGGGKTVVSTYTDEETGDVIAVYSDGTTAVISKGNKVATAALVAQQAAAAEAERKREQGQSAYTLLLEQFNQYGLGSLVEPLKQFIIEGLSPAEFTLRLRDTDAYKKRFAANQQRINRGLRALSEAEYIGLEDQYQNVMRNYGLPASYYTRGEMGRQEGFEKFIGGDVSAAELEDRIQTAQNRVINAAPQVSQALREFYPGITNGDILAYALDPDKALTDIRRKVTAAEIGAGAMQAGLATGVARAEELGRFGVTGEQARQGFSTIAEFLPSAQKLSDIYRKQGLGDFTQATAEQEVFGIAGAAEAGRKRRKLTELETAAFSGQAGVAGGALARERAGQY
jgi:hypothetical protein